MSNRIGVLGEAVTATVGNTTAYTVPASKTAKFRIQWRGLNAAVGNATVEIFVNGISIMKTGNIAVSAYAFSTPAFLNSASTAAPGPTGESLALTVAPAPPIYYGNAGDIVSYTIATNALSTMSLQVVGVEVDV